MPGHELLEFNVTSPHFYLIHISAITSLSISILVSLATLIFLCLDGPARHFFHRRRGERLVVYLALTDLLFSCQHIVDHIYALVTGDLPGGTLCVVSAFFLQEFYTAQSLIILSTAFTSYMLIRHDYKIGFGRWDIGLLLLSFGLPLVIGTVLVSLDLLGPSVYWCLANLENPHGFIVDNIFTSITLAVAILNVIFYVSTWLQVHTISTQVKHLGGDKHSGGQTDKQTAFLMMAIVLAYLAQWWPYMIYAAWNLFTPPHIAIVECIVIFCNLGGVFNFFAYTFIRRRYRTTIRSISRTGTITTDSSDRKRSDSTDTVISFTSKMDCHLYKKSTITRPDGVEENGVMAGVHI